MQSLCAYNTQRDVMFALKANRIKVSATGVLLRGCPAVAGVGQREHSTQFAKRCTKVFELLTYRKFYNAL